MRYFSFLMTLVLALGLWTCEKDDNKNDTAELILSFHGQFNSNTLKMFSAEYPYLGDSKLRFQLFQFYISDVALLKTDNPQGDSVQLLDIALVSFKNIQTEDAAQKGVRFTIKNIPPGRYKGIKFGLGVSADLNAVGPSAYTPPHPLDDNYWSWAKGYVFSKIEGNADLDKSGKFATKLTFHIGENEFYRKKLLLKDLEIKAKSTNTFSLDVDLYRVLAESTSNYLDFRKVTQDHTSDRVVAQFISDNLQQAIVLGKE
jgi:hypothetical protein